MMMLLLMRLPKTGDVVTWEGWKFEVADMDGRRIDKVLAQRVNDVPATESNDKTADKTPAQENH